MDKTLRKRAGPKPKSPLDPTSAKAVHVGLQLPSDVVFMLRELAVKDGVSDSAFIRKRLVDHVRARYVNEVFKAGA